MIFPSFSPRRWLLAQLLCALSLLVVAPEAMASCGDYLAPRIASTGHDAGTVSGRGVRPNTDPRMLFAWQVNKPCGGPGCEQDPQHQPQTISTSVHSRPRVSIDADCRYGWFEDLSDPVSGIALAAERFPAGMPSVIFRPPLRHNVFDA